MHGGVANVGYLLEQLLVVLSVDSNGKIRRLRWDVSEVVDPFV